MLYAYRKGSRLGHDTLVDGLMKDGLWDVYNDYGMGVCAEICAEQHGITRDDQVHQLAHRKIFGHLVILLTFCNQNIVC